MRDDCPWDSLTLIPGYALGEFFRCGPKDSSTLIPGYVSTLYR